MPRPIFLSIASVIGSFTVALFGTPVSAEAPNVVVIVTDDQGYGDIAAHGNRVIQTPHLDRLYHESLRLTNFHVDPTCSPTRSALMSGRYSTRTGVWHTIMGRSLMDTREYTMAEMFRDAGYRTAMFGKWHLGDNAPCRPQDQGFETAFCHGGGGVGQTPDYFGNDYFDDTYFREGQAETQSGYCTDVWFHAARQFIGECHERGERFFVYLATNAPHGPFHVADQYAQPYRDLGLTDTMARFYGMITNIDENLGAFRQQLSELGIADQTLLVFLTDNGTAAGYRPQEDATWSGFNAGMRGTKGSAYDGGHRVPCYVHWPGGNLLRDHDVPILTAHIDLLPTLARLCNIDIDHSALDGADVSPLFRASSDDQQELQSRTLFVHSQRIEHPRKWKTSAVMTSQWRLINGEELYAIDTDPVQATDVAAAHPAIVSQLRDAYESWWTRLAEPMDGTVRIDLGHPSDNPTTLTAHDWHTDNGPVPWNQTHIRKGIAANGFWAVTVQRGGRYRFTLRRWPEENRGPVEATDADLRIGDQIWNRAVDPAVDAIHFEVELAPGDFELQTTLRDQAGTTRGAYYVTSEWLAPLISTTDRAPTTPE